MKSHGHWEIEELNLGAFLLNMSLTKIHLPRWNGHFMVHFSDVREKLLSLSYSYTKMQQDHSWPSV
jgi:hypothetical protein